MTIAPVMCPEGGRKGLLLLLFVRQAERASGATHISEGNLL
jgi:hypothetical protein